jgi:hypothetical protein
MNLAALIRNQTMTTRPVLLVPAIEDVRRTARRDIKERVDTQLRDSAKLLASHNFWKRNRRGLRPGIERFDAVNQRPAAFVPLDLSSFIAALEAIFEIRTTTSGPFALDRCIGDMLWEACTAPGILPEASWAKELELREAAQRRG